MCMLKGSISQLNHRYRYTFGIMLCMTGLLGDCVDGLVLLMSGEWQPLLWHLPLALMWAVGVYLITWRDNQGNWILCVKQNKWGVTALLLGVSAFPGLGLCAYSTALFITRYFFSAITAHSFARSEPEMRTLSTLSSLPPAPTRLVQPLVDDLQVGDTESRRSVVSKLSHHANPVANQLLRRLLSDSRAEIRSDASIALSRLDDEMSRILNHAFEAWNANPKDTGCIVALADQSYRYAASNVLDRKSQRFYLVLAGDLLMQI